jgi:hypothetical protein
MLLRCSGSRADCLLSRRALTVCCYRSVFNGSYFRNLEIPGLGECHGSVPALAPGTDPGRGLARMERTKSHDRSELEPGASSLSTYSCK